MTALVGTPAAILLAAGEGKRLGPRKLFETIDAKPIIERAAHAFLQAQKVTDVVIVIPPGQTEAFSWLRSVKVHLVENPEPELGMMGSIRVALRSSWVKGRDFLLSPADIPFIKPDVVNRVIQAFLTRNCRIVIPTYQGLGGHPAMFAASLMDDFFLRGDTHGTREILLRHKGETVRLAVPDPDICFDIDTPEDLRIAADPGARWAQVERMVEEKRKGQLR